MRPILILFFLALTCGACNKSLNSQIQSIHNDNQQQVSALDTMVSNLLSLRNSILIQGRALMPDEISFVDRVDDVELGYTEAKDRLQQLSTLPPDSSKLSAEKALQARLKELHAQADSLLNIRN